MNPLRAAHHVAGEVGKVARAESELHHRLRVRLTGLVLLTVGVDLVCAVLAYLFENGEKGTQIKSFGSAIFWTSTQLLTVSSQMPNPVTTAGRVLDVFMEFWAVSFVTAMAGAMGAFLVKRAEQTHL
jgi:hypothetical protein